MAETPQTRRAFGFWICLALVIGNMIGSGVFLLPQQLAPYGWNAILGWGVTIPGALCLAFVFASLARRFPRAGGPYAYTVEAFGAAPGFAVAWSYWISVWTANAAIALAAVSYLSHFLPGLAAAPGLAAIGFVWTFTLINCLSVKGTGEVQLATTILKLLPLVAAIFLTLRIAATGDRADAVPLPTGDISLAGVTATAALTLWAMVGFESATIPAGHVRDPERTIPRATLIGTFATGLIYLIACSGVALLLPPAQAAASNAPFADFIGRYWGPGPASLVALFAAISALGALNGWVLIQGEMPVALARDGMFPAWMAKTSKAGTPVRAHLVSTGLVTLLLLANQSRSMGDLFAFMALLSTAASLVAYLSCSLAALRLQAAARLPGSWILPPVAVAGAVYSAWAIYGAGPEPALWGAALLLSGLPVYIFMKRNLLRGRTVRGASATVED
ncbi:MAG: basic amino acid/polyamine antiporter, family [Sphingomonadales bacterium]|jgi:APA family basic amino acid/polyamine antiporter|nr:basic amino acid/polyamine antiporter, family [Sphingomonadales bacterium]